MELGVTHRGIPAFVVEDGTRRRAQSSLGGRLWMNRLHHRCTLLEGRYVFLRLMAVRVHPITVAHQASLERFILGR